MTARCRKPDIPGYKIQIIAPTSAEKISVTEILGSTPFILLSFPMVAAIVLKENRSYEITTQPYDRSYRRQYLVATTVDIALAES